MKNNMKNQNIFKDMAVGGLRDKLRSGESICDYFKKDVEYPLSYFFESPIKVDIENLILQLKGENDSSGNDINAAMALYEAFSELSEAQASDPRLWVYLTHVSLREYVLERWPNSESCEQVIGDSNKKETVINNILSHWFATGGNDRSLRRNAIARLWWAVRLTRAPWEADQEFFSDLIKEEDVYRFTRVLLSTQDIYQQVLERGLGRDNRMLITVLEFIEEHKNITREQIRDFMKELNLGLSVRNFAVLGRQELKRAIFAVGSEVLKP
jgi:hypothetical protein